MRHDYVNESAPFPIVSRVAPCEECGRVHLGHCALTIRQLVERAAKDLQAALLIAWQQDLHGKPKCGWWTRHALGRAQHVLVRLLVNSEDLR